MMLTFVSGKEPSDDSLPYVAPQIDTTTVVRIDEAEPPPMYQVWMLNDDFTPMDFVVVVLVEVFKKEHGEAEEIMWRIHRQGRALVGVYSYDIAQTKVADAMSLALAAEYPLRCLMERI